MTSERVLRRLERLLDQIDAAEVEGDWQQVGELARDVLSVDPDNAEARAYLDSAERRLGPQAADAVASKAVSSPADAIPTSFANGRYEVKSLLGEGGKKLVYLVHDITLDRDVAFGLIKADGLDDASRQRVIREAQAMARLGDNPNIMPIFDLGEENGQPFMVGPLMGGGDVEALIEDAEDGRLSLEDALRISSEVCRGLELAHEKGVIHRDLKPGNVWLTDDGTARIGDFGLAISLDRSRLTQEKMMVGTVSYMPPEQATGGEITPKADLYSLGAMLYEMVTGRTPFMGDDDIAIIGQHINTPPVAPQWHRPEIPAQLDSLIMRLLSKNPAERPESAGDVLSALEAMDISPREVPADSDGTETGSLDSMAGGVFVGRHREMDQLKASLENALSGRGSMVTLVGEPGIGKTRTSLELETYAGLRTAQVLWGRCYEGGGAPPYWPWVQAIRSFVASHDPDQVRSQMGSSASVISEIVEEVKTSLPDVEPPAQLEDPESARFRLFDSITTFLKNAAQVQPLVLVLDDLHWADKPSLMLLEFVARELASSRILIVGTYRDMELNRRHPLSVTLGDLTRERLFERVLLRGLTRGDIARFIEIAAGLTPPRGLVDAVHTQTEGNPLFVTETVRLLVQEGELAQKDGSRSDSSWNIRIPEGVREVIGRRLDHLSERCNEVLTIASVIGRQFTLDQLRVVAEDTTEDQLLDVLDEAIAARVLEELPDAIGLYHFSHALMQETLGGEITLTRRVRLHARVAEALEEMYGSEADKHAESLAEHFAGAETVLGSERLIHYSIIAQETAASGYAYEEVERIATRALGLLGDDDTLNRARFLTALGVARSSLIKNLDEAQPAWDLIKEAVELYLSAGEPEAAVYAATTYIPTFWAVTGPATLLEMLSEVVPKGTAAEARLQERLSTAMLTGRADIPAARRAARRALEIARELKDPILESGALHLLPFISFHEADYERSREESETALLKAREAGNSNAEVRSLAYLAIGGASSKGPEEVAQAAQQLGVVAERLRESVWIIIANMFGVLARFNAGEVAESPISDDESQGEFRGMNFTGLGYQRGDFSERAQMVEMLTNIVETSTGASTIGIIAVAVSGRIAGDRELLEETRQATERLLRRNLTVHQRLLVLQATLVCAVEAEDTDRVALLLSELDGLPVVNPGSLFITFDRLLALGHALIGNADVAETHFTGALDWCRENQAIPETAWTCSDYAEFLIKRNDPGDREKATELQDEAIAIAQKMGLKPLLERVLAQREILKA